MDGRGQQWKRMWGREALGEEEVEGHVDVLWKKSVLRLGMSRRNVEEVGGLEAGQCVYGRAIGTFYLSRRLFALE